MSDHRRFLWGAASAAAQVEGAWNDDGRCPSIWDIAGDHIRNGEDCHTSCDHYHRFREDVALMRELGLNSYRFSVSWCRIVPERGRINPKGLAFYSELVDELIKAGIEPLVTLYHWDLPVWIQEMGGWAAPEIIDEFLAYTQAVIDALSARVACWMTFNEPQCFLGGGYQMGFHAPFLQDQEKFRHGVQHMLLAHGKTVSLLRKNAKKPPKIGIAMAAYTYIPRSESEADLREAAEKSFVTSRMGREWNSLYMDPIGLGTAPDLMKDLLSPEDLKIISAPIDFVGVNVYQALNVRVDSEEYLAQDLPRTMLDWVIDGRCLYWTIRQYYERYHLPVMVTENGMAWADIVSSDGRVHDVERIRFLDEFIGEMNRAIREDIPVLGYLHWSVMDNFEWCEGYGPRFGLIHVDYETQKRTIKDSGYHYAEIIRNAGNV